jgi:hypothetical protein
MSKEHIVAVEKQIDQCYADNKLKELNFAQAVWTLLSVAEDHHIKIQQIRPLPEVQRLAYIDTFLNYLSYPLRVCLNESEKLSTKIDNRLIDEHYQLAQNWLDVSRDYYHFCSIFPLWHKGKIDLSIEDNKLVVTGWNTLALEYEAYNRLVRKTGDRTETAIDPSEVAGAVISCSSASNDEFKVNFNPKLVKELMEFWERASEGKYNLPNDWQFTYFTVGQFKSVFMTIQAMLVGWHVARVVFASNGMDALGYRSAVWVVAKKELENRLQRYTGIRKNIVCDVLRFITFGHENIRDPDIAIQPLIYLGNEKYALSPFIWMNTDAERNLCVLLNLIDSERAVYSQLVNDKEILLRNELIDAAKLLGYECKFGKLKDTDVDLALISREERACVALELKWFIEPAEIREVIDRSEELKKGVAQAKRVDYYFKENDTRLIKQILDIESDYNFLAVVGSKNWIGDFDAQDEEIPIIKIGHLFKKIGETGSISEVIKWLKERSYLPVRNKDFDVVSINLSCGEWQAVWYGIKLANKRSHKDAI